jgi:hypothetical protein
MHEDLGQAVRQALLLSRKAARAHARTFTWAHCAALFRGALVHATAAARAEEAA